MSKHELTYISNVNGFFSEYYLGLLLTDKHWRGKLGETTRNKVYLKLLHLRGKKPTLLAGDESRKFREREKMASVTLRLLEQNRIILLKIKDFQELSMSLDESNWHFDEEDEKSTRVVAFIVKAKGHRSPLSNHRLKSFILDHVLNIIKEKGIKWGIITDGALYLLLASEKLKRKSYLEVDLDSILREHVRSSFHVFWALFRKDAFTLDVFQGKSLIEDLDLKSRQFAKLVSEHLQKSVVPNLERFIQGILRDERNQACLDSVHQLAETLYKEALSFMLRIIIILFAESRKVLPIENPIYWSYSLQNIKSQLIHPEKVLSRKKTTWLWESIWKLFELLEKGIDNAQLKLKALGGQLFDSSRLKVLRSLILTDDIMNKFLEPLMFTTLMDESRIKQEIAYHEFDVEQIGAIYEVFLHLEPAMAEEDLVIFKGGTTRRKIIPKKEMSSALTLEGKDIQVIPKGQFYFKNWAGTKKGTGTYYTPPELTNFIVKTAIEPLLKDKKPDEILEIAILDPAMGSGAFLVSATLYLTKKYQEACRSVGLNESELPCLDEVAVRRLIVQNCIHGVDLNPLAVELAKVSLWLLTMSKNQPLTFLDANLKVGNSLIGFTTLSETKLQVISKTLRRQWGKEITKKFLENLPLPSRQLLLDLVILHLLDDDSNNRISFQEIFGKIASVDEREGIERCEHAGYEQLIKSARRKWRIFHWCIEFPEVLKKGGFDAIVTNPPWNILKPNSNEFFSKYINNFRKIRKKERLKLMQDLLEKDFKVKQLWENHVSDLKKASLFFNKSGLYKRQFRGDLNLYKLFVERSFSLVKRNGYLGMILPSAIYTDYGARDLRRMFLKDSQLQYLFSLENREGLFHIHKSYKITLLLTKKLPSSPKHRVKTAFCLGSRPKSLKKDVLPPEIIVKYGCAPKRQELEELLSYLKTNGLMIEQELVKKLNPISLAFLEFKNEMDLNLAKKLHESFPRFVDTSMNLPWNVSLNREFDMTNDLKYFLIKEKAEQLILRELPLARQPYQFFRNENSFIKKERQAHILPLYEGKMIWQFNPFYASARYWVTFPPPKPLKSLQSNGILPYRTAFRAISGSTNERTLVACVLPPTYHGNTLQSLMININRLQEGLNQETVQLLACGLLNSLVLDWIIRLKVTSGLNYHFIHSLPFPRLTPKDGIFRQLIPRIARLSCISADFADLWAKTYQEEWYREVQETSVLADWKLLSSTWSSRQVALDFVTFKDEKRDGNIRAILRAEIDALIGHLFKLNVDELNHILSSFPVLERKERKYLGEFRTKTLVTEYFSKVGHIL